MPPPVLPEISEQRAFQALQDRYQVILLVSISHGNRHLAFTNRHLNGNSVELQADILEVEVEISRRTTSG